MQNGSEMLLKTMNPVTKETILIINTEINFQANIYQSSSNVKIEDVKIWLSDFKLNKKKAEDAMLYLENWNGIFHYFWYFTDHMSNRVK